MTKFIICNKLKNLNIFDVSYEIYDEFYAINQSNIVSINKINELTFYTIDNGIMFVNKESKTKILTFKNQYIRSINILGINFYQNYSINCDKINIMKINEFLINTYNLSLSFGFVEERPKVKNYFSSLFLDKHFFVDFEEECKITEY